MSFQESHGRQIHDSLECSRNFRLGKILPHRRRLSGKFFPLVLLLDGQSDSSPRKGLSPDESPPDAKHIRIQIIIISDLYHAFPIRKCRVSLIQTLIISLVIIIHVFQIYFGLKRVYRLKRDKSGPLFRQSHAKMFIQQIDIGSNR